MQKEKIQEKCMHFEYIAKWNLKYLKYIYSDLEWGVKQFFFDKSLLRCDINFVATLLLGLQQYHKGMSRWGE